MDLLGNPDAVKTAVVQVSKDWLRYREACHSAIHEWKDGYIHWWGNWSKSPSVNVQCDDYSIVISPETYQESPCRPLRHRRNGGLSITWMVQALRGTWRGH